MLEVPGYGTLERCTIFTFCAFAEMANRPITQKLINFFNLVYLDIIVYSLIIFDDLRITLFSRT